MDGLRAIERHASDQLSTEALADNAAWTRLVALAASGDVTAIATISKMYGRLVYSMNRGRHRHVDDHEGDVLEALWAAIQERPGCPEAFLRSARRTMDRAATVSRRAARTATFDEVPAAAELSRGGADDAIEQICTRDQLTEVIAQLDARVVRAFAARAGLVPHDSWTKSPTARSLVRNVRQRLVAA